MRMWDCLVFAKIAIMLGHSISIDSVSNDDECMDFARVCLKMNLTSKFPHEDQN